MRRSAVLAAAVLSVAGLTLAACQSADEPKAPPPSESPQAQDVPTESSDTLVDVGPIGSAELLEGEYRVAGIGDYDLADLDFGFAVSITQQEIRVLADCIDRHWTYRFEGERLVTQPVEGRACGRALLDEERALMAAFTGAERVGRLPSNGIVFEGKGGTVTLFSQ